MKPLSFFASALIAIPFLLHAKAPKELVETQKQQVAEWQTQLLSLEEVRQSLLGLVGK